MRTLRFAVFGKVQGVSYRANTQQKAQDLGLSGWVRNCKDGSVELVARGEIAKLHELNQWCFEGSPWSDVERVEVGAWSGDEPSQHGFEILPDA